MLYSVIGFLEQQAHEIKRDVFSFDESVCDIAFPIGRFKYGTKRYVAKLGEMLNIVVKSDNDLHVPNFSPALKVHALSSNIDTFVLTTPQVTDNEHGQMRVAIYMLRAYAMYLMKDDIKQGRLSEKNAKCEAWRFTERAILGTPEDYMQLLERVSIQKLHDIYDVPISFSSIYASRVFRGINCTYFYSITQGGSIIKLEPHVEKCTVSCSQVIKYLDRLKQTHQIFSHHEKPAHYMVETLDSGIHQVFGDGLATTYRTGFVRDRYTNEKVGQLQRTFFVDTTSADCSNLIM